MKHLLMNCASYWFWGLNKTWGRQIKLQTCLCCRTNVLFLTHIVFKQPWHQRDFAPSTKPQYIINLFHRSLKKVLIWWSWYLVFKYSYGIIQHKHQVIKYEQFVKPQNIKITICLLFWRFFNLLRFQRSWVGLTH